MPQLVLVRHSNSDHNPVQPATDWQLSEAGLRRCQPLARHLAQYHPKRLHSSSMPKALHTAKAVARELGDLPVSECPLLAEHRRESNAPYGTVASFNARMKRLFACPNQLIFGDETAEAAKQRFQRGINSILENTSSAENVLVFSHGTVMVLFVAQYNPIDSYSFWKRLDMPAVIALDLPDFRICHVI